MALNLFEGHCIFEVGLSIPCFYRETPFGNYQAQVVDIMNGSSSKVRRVESIQVDQISNHKIG